MHGAPLMSRPAMADVSTIVDVHPHAAQIKAGVVSAHRAVSPTACSSSCEDEWDALLDDNTDW